MSAGKKQRKEVAPNDDDEEEDDYMSNDFLEQMHVYKKKSSSFELFFSAKLCNFCFVFLQSRHKTWSHTQPNCGAKTRDREETSAQIRRELNETQANVGEAFRGHATRRCSEQILARFHQ